MIEKLTVIVVSFALGVIVTDLVYSLRAPQEAARDADVWRANATRTHPEGCMAITKE